MAICGTCGSDTKHIRSRWNEDGRLPDECPNCSPESFDGKFTVPSDKKIWMGYEAHPNEYVKVHHEDGGVEYIRKKEYRAEQEQKLAEATAEEKEAQAKAVAHKRATRRTTPMDSAELSAALAKAQQIADFMVESASKGVDVN